MNIIFFPLIPQVALKLGYGIKFSPLLFIRKKKCYQNLVYREMNFEVFFSDNEQEMKRIICFLFKKKNVLRI